MKSIVQKLFKGGIDIIGDVHGEFAALLSLMENLGYDSYGNHPAGRKLVFVGDLCDRGNNSPMTVLLVKRLVQNGNAQAVLGNHELNILLKKRKDGNGWFFKEQHEFDSKYAPFEFVSETEAEEIYDFFNSLPLALENDELRVVHAAWSEGALDLARLVQVGNITKAFSDFESDIDGKILDSGLREKYEEEQEANKWKLTDKDKSVEMLVATREYSLLQQNGNPLKVLTSGLEVETNKPFFTSGKWRFVERMPWWEAYEDRKPVVIGHYWRTVGDSHLGFKQKNIFDGVAHNEWHGKLGNVFCVDYSVGARFKVRSEGQFGNVETALAALRWPEKIIMLEGGKEIQTKGFCN